MLHLIDCTQDDIVGAYNTIRGELEQYGHGLDTKPEIIAINKVDALGEELAEDQRKTLEDAIGKPVMKMSAVSGQGVKDALYALGKTIYDSKEEERRIESGEDDEAFSP